MVTNLLFLVTALVSYCQGLTKYEKLDLAFTELFKNETMDMLWKQHLQQFQSKQRRGVAHYYDDFNCHNIGPPASHTKPTSVHKLSPWDIDVVAAMGDSLTAGNGISASSWVGVLTEYRGKSWNIGGDGSLDQGVITLPNILRKFNPNLKGYSLNFGDRNGADANLNVADPGHTSHDMPDQARMLVQRIKSEPGVNFLTDWKMVTLFIGGNDLCDYCNDNARYSADNYINNIRTALDILHAEMPRTFVNLVEIFDVTPVAALSQGFFCSFVTSYACECGKDSASVAAVRQAAFDYQFETEVLIASERYNTRDDFTVVLQPFFRTTVPPNQQGTSSPDLSYFSPDCFHFSEKGQYAAAHSLWNNLLEPISRKDEAWYINEPYLCPNTHATGTGPYFATTKNSA
ncbi:phospholipase B1, membrane-associated-like [Mizuhopecten yessoensis]|uniref:phospholipase B1, membrane-associated-like n=1 Tax=Mizuhopecten yessoensis TaxID=6573 RepID=UPI000B45D011|nr:phospholipase B1, membrane-associated-like [Mizuhopecten yessoensis]